MLRKLAMWWQTPSKKNAPILDTSPQKNSDEEKQTAVFAAGTNTAAINSRLLTPPTEDFLKKHDSLSALQDELVKLKIKFVNDGLNWKQQRDAILSSGVLAVDEAQVKKTINVRETLLRWLAEIKTWVQSAEKTLHDLHERSSPHIKALCTDLQVACSQLAGTPKTETQLIKKLELHICDLSIEVLDELKTLINDVEAEIIRCLKCEALGETVAKLLAIFILEALIRIPLPDFNFAMAELSLTQLTFSGLYRDFLFQNIHKETKTIDTFIQNTDNTINQARAVIDQYEQHLQLSR